MDRRARSGAFLTKRVRVSKEDAGALFTAYKSQEGLTWNNLAADFDVHVNTLKKRWSKGKTTIPLSVYTKLAAATKLTGCGELLENNWAQKLVAERKWLAIERFRTVEFAELYGAMLGDGCVYSSGRTLCLTGNAILDNHYFGTYLPSLLKFVFDCEPRIYDDNSKIRVVVNNAAVCANFLKIGYPLGTKKNSQVTIPVDYFRDERLLIACIRGLFDSDGGVFPHPHSKLMISVSSKIPSLLESMKAACSAIGLSYGSTGTAIQFYSDNAHGFFSKVGSSNPRNSCRYFQYLKTGEVPNAKDLPKFLNGFTTLPSTTYGPVV
jgi:hypothetical protein